jgi:hypothetical protein
MPVPPRKAQLQNKRVRAGAQRWWLARCFATNTEHTECLKGSNQLYLLAGYTLPDAT